MFEPRFGESSSPKVRGQKPGRYRLGRYVGSARHDAMDTRARCLGQP